MISDLIYSSGMGRNAVRITCGEEDRLTMEKWAVSRTEPRQRVERARMVLGCVNGARVQEVAHDCATRPNTVMKWRDRYARLGLKGLDDAVRPGYGSKTDLR